MSRTDYIINKQGDDYIGVSVHKMDAEGRWFDEGHLFSIIGKEFVRAVMDTHSAIFKHRPRTDAGYQKMVDQWNAYMAAIHLGYKIKAEEGLDAQSYLQSGS